MESDTPQKTELEIAQMVYRFALRTSIPLLALGLLIELVTPSKAIFGVSSQSLIWLGLAVLFLAPITLLFTLTVYYLKNEKQLGGIALLSFVIAIGVLIYKVFFY